MCAFCLKIATSIATLRHASIVVLSENSFYAGSFCCKKSRLESAYREIHERVSCTNKRMKWHRAHAFSLLICRAWPLFYPWSSWPVGSYLAIMARYQHFTSLYVTVNLKHLRFYAKKDFSKFREHVCTYDKREDRNYLRSEVFDDYGLHLPAIECSSRCLPDS